jgi:hypothetical protein
MEAWLMTPSDLIKGGMKRKRFLGKPWIKVENDS